MGQLLAVKFWVLQFTSSFQWMTQEVLGIQVDLNTTFHPQNNGQLGCNIIFLQDIPHACVLGFKGQSEQHLTLAEFANNNI